ncbi:hypothetical protein [Nocardia australiensis]|uniref:hypothetical protein n=1 Tax=Nocardia australiensis TaxID=2887191 RepID=UPI003556B4AD
MRAGDKLNSDFTADAPNLVWVADFTYVSTWTGWTVSATKMVTLVSNALNMAVWRRGHPGHSIEPGLIHHSDAGSQAAFSRRCDVDRLRHLLGPAQ